MKTKFDTTEIRELNVQMYGLTGLDKKYTFYYDETNNIRKFYLRENSFNSASELNFVVGGVLHEGNNCNSDIEKLFEGLKLQKSVNELKLKHIAQGDFLECLKSAKLNYFLKWLLNSDLYVHYSSLNILYFSIVDIVDSAVMNFEKYQELDRWYIDLMKDNLYQVSRIEEETMIELFFKYQYPNIKKENAIDFIDELIEIISPYEDIEELHLGIASLRQLLKQSKKTKDLPFIMDEEDFILLEDFKLFYMTPIYMFKNSEHIFDREDGIEEEINKHEIIYKGEIINSYSFVDSKDNKLIQISDVFIGLFGKFTSYVNISTLLELNESISTMNLIQLDNLKLIHQIIDKSDSKNKAFLHAVESSDGQKKYGFISYMIKNKSA